ncbi:hypothetical protein CERSUDRAFT_97689 [Gelatoporia subvermispora B]|uniref:UBZ4-type domain-containing protein n=1 Tax=Ceriporiopsis subvermispora (strain B) TaxID=914234 RepID=M2QQK0_CERS8|nr:hypothetical protein CERSUDRAFT_97689 [Gelatoporia subvermispora B]
MENAVKAWSLGRDFVLELLKRSEDHVLLGPQGKPSDMDSLRDRPHKRQRTDEGDVVLVEGKVTLGASTANGVRSPKPKNVKRNYKSQSPVPILSPSPDAVECPICNKMVVERMINQHIDSGCLSYLSEASSSGARGEQKMQWSKLFGNTESTRKGKDKGKAKAKDRHANNDAFRRPAYQSGSDIDDLFNADPLPKMSYDVLKDKRIQEYLMEHDLPTTGSRDACIARHQKWVMLFNANLDRSANRQNLSQLREELETWEAAQRKPRTQNVTDSIAHQKQHKDEFERLKEEARRRAPVKRDSMATIPGDIVVIDDEE